MQQLPGLDRLTVDESVMGGQVCVRGLRFTAEQLVELHVNGWSDNQIIAEYPFIEPDDIQQSLRYALSLMRREIYLPFAASA
jgi:uncharacterized protein (DUF433 family)